MNAVFVGFSAAAMFGALALFALLVTDGVYFAGVFVTPGLVGLLVAIVRRSVKR